MQARAVGQRGEGQRGSVIVEVALLVPLLVLLLWGIIEFGQGYNAQVELTAAVREGARAAALSSGDPTSATTAAAPGLTPTSISVSVVTSCPPNATGNALVRATYPFHYDIPFFGAGTWTLKATGVMRCGG